MNPNIYPPLAEELKRNIVKIQPSAEIQPSREWVKIMPDWYNKRQYSKWIQIYTSLDTVWIHYEYYGGYVCLHLEGEYTDKKYARQVRELKLSVKEFESEIKWLAPDSDCISCIIREEVNGTKDLIAKLARLVEIFDENIVNIFSKNTTFRELKGEYDMAAPEYRSLSEERVSIQNMGITDVFDLPLTIPDYQRIYCWENKQIEALWESLKEIQPNTPYHLGTLIMQDRNGSYEIVDGQQRLVTLSLILWGLGYTGNIPLLNQRFKDSDAIKHVRNSKAVLTTLIRDLRNNQLLATILESLKFSVIVIKGNNLDLAYTFFSNTNSKGVKLSDYDLLKAHHLRYISSEPQARHLANSWSRLTQKKEDSKENMEVENSLGNHVYRLRRLIRKDSFNEYGHYIRDEFQASPIMSDVPPFGERFDYYEPIQGGPHFFAFVEHFNEHYKSFIKLPQVIKLRDHFINRHRVYEEMAETMLFAYYLKFQSQYLSEALFCILSKLAEHRYSKVRALENQVQRYAIDSNIVQHIQFSTSPTFFLAAVLKEIQTGIMDYDITDGIRWDFYKKMCGLFSSMNDITVTEIQKSIENEF